MDDAGSLKIYYCENSLDCNIFNSKDLKILNSQNLNILNSQDLNILNSLDLSIFSRQRKILILNIKTDFTFQPSKKSWQQYSKEQTASSVGQHWVWQRDIQTDRQTDNKEVIPVCQPTYTGGTWAQKKWNTILVKPQNGCM